MASPIISIIDSYYQFVSQQMVAINAQINVNGALIQQPMCGYVQARDWPQTPQVEGGLYLLILSTPLGGGLKSRAQEQVEVVCQWQWLLVGTDITAIQLAQNRGDRFRTNFQITENLRQANYPRFCRKQDYSVTPTGVLQSIPSTSVYPVSPIESVTWTPLRFMPHTDSQISGLTFGVAALELYGFSDVNVAIA